VHLNNVAYCIVNSLNHRVKCWEIIANTIISAGFSVGWVSALDDDRRTVWIVDAHRDGKRFIVHSDDKLTAFLELETATHEFAVDLISKTPPRDLTSAR